MSDPLSVLILGCGDIAGGFDEIGGLAIRTHAGAYHTDSRFKMRACVEPNVERREAFMEYWGVRAGYGDLESCLASEERFDVVSVTNTDANWIRVAFQCLICRGGNVLR